MRTVRGYDFYACTSAMQKAIRRGDARLAGYFGIELWESNYKAYVWRRLLVISAEDCWGILTQEIEALYRGHEMVAKNNPSHSRIFVAKALILLAQAKKSRDADHLSCLGYDRKMIADDVVDAAINECRDAAPGPDIPEYAYDCHTREGKRKGKTKEQFFKEEHAGLKPREAGLFDGDVESL